MANVSTWKSQKIEQTEKRNTAWVISRKNETSGLVNYYLDDPERSYNEFFEQGQVNDWRWSSNGNKEGFLRVHYFHTRDEASQALLGYCLRMNELGRSAIYDGFTYSLNEISDTRSYKAVLRNVDRGILSEEDLDRAIALAGQGKKRREILMELGHVMTQMTVDAIKKELEYFRKLGFGRFQNPEKFKNMRFTTQILNPPWNRVWKESK